MATGDLFIDGVWRSGTGPEFTSLNPATNAVLWQGHAATPSDVDQAVHAARTAFEDWAGRGLEERLAVIEAFARLLEDNHYELAEAISLETGKPLWDSAGEVGAMRGKVEISQRAYAERTPSRVDEQNGGRSRLTHRPHGVMAVFGPFNFPGHLPNGHIVPALIAGNTIVFKPSELTPMVAEKTLELWQRAGLPAGVINLVQGARETGEALAAHDGIDGLLFTGSSATGRLLHRQFAGRPDKILALEMGGNNPLIVHKAGELAAAAIIIAQSAYLSAGQRCTCARRLILPEGAEADAVIAAVAELIGRIHVGPFDGEEEPFMGPVISGAAADKLMAAQEHLIAGGGRALVAMTRPDETLPFLTPGLIDVSEVVERADVEYFGPLLQVIRVADFDAAIREANATRYGLSAALISDDPDLRDVFYARIRAGIVNWNRPTNGASSAAPFGGIGLSGNHRPSAYYAADYCAYPMASMETDRLRAPDSLPPGIAP